MVIPLEIEAFLEKAKILPLTDIRSEGEFALGHIPNAISFPLFTNTERALVGTCYKKEGKNEAIKLGLKLVGPKLATFVENAEQIAPEKELCVYCWRGGMRSGSMAWLLSTAGFKIYVLKKGYKNFRNHVLSMFQKDFTLHILGGMTGSGKTEIIHYLKEKNAPVIDLEGLAKHKGSAFGINGIQPSTEMFENLLFQELSKLDLSKPIWVEDESHSIGKVYINDFFWHKMRNNTLFSIQVSFEKRLDRIVEEYGKLPKEQLLQSIENIKKRLGGLEYSIAKEAVENNDLKTAAAIILKYYDKGYLHGQSKRDSQKIIKLSFENESISEIGDRLLMESSKN
jgi:tRNA 2-selenouridine synthase